MLVAVQGFRLPLEIAMHALVARGIMPVQMSYSGRNFDIVTGAAAVIVAVLVKAGYGGRRLVAAWNVLGLGLLVNVVTVAIVSTPRIRYFGDQHVVTFVTYTPFVWLPAVMVARRAGRSSGDLQGPPSLIIPLFYDLRKFGSGSAGGRESR